MRSDAIRQLAKQSYTPFTSNHRSENVIQAFAGASQWQSREILESILDSAPMAIVMVDDAGTIRYANRQLEDLFGYRSGELNHRPIETLIPERFRSDHIRHRQNYTQNPHVRAMGSGLDLAGRRKNGEEFPLEAGLSQVRIHDQTLVIATITDITRRKQTEEVLEHRVEERTREIERRRAVSDGLRDILTVLNSNQPLEDILTHIAAQACRLLYADASAIFRIPDDQGPLQVQASYGLEDVHVRQASVPSNVLAAPQVVDLDTDESANYTMRFAEPYELVPQVVHSDDVMHITLSGGKDTRHDEPLEWGSNSFRALLTVPLTIKEETYGSLILYYDEARKFTSEEIELATTVGDQTALAIENARLRTQVERTAVAAERSRIARDLHDSVTQTLFSASLIAEVLPRIWGRDEEECKRRLEELRQLTRGALAEMRTLLLELRPATLIEVELQELLRQLTEAISGRSRVPITLEIHGDPALPPDVKTAFYHITQEALNNVAKHARASMASVVFTQTDATATLSVKDNGRGFILDKVTPEHLGLSIMHERAEAIGARLEVNSQLEHGTEVIIEWSERERRESGEPTAPRV